jgi:predicted ribosomally synthesized peptide with nif11-like leader
MSEEQLSALLARLEVDAGLLEKLKDATDLDAAIALAREAGFDVSEADWLRYQEGMGEGELSDEELGSVAGGLTHLGTGERKGMKVGYVNRYGPTGRRAKWKED